LYGLDKCSAAKREQNQPRFGVELAYDNPAPDGPDVKTVGQRVTVLSDNTGCSYRWDQGSAPPGSLRPARVVRLHADDCALGEPVVAALATALGPPIRPAPPRSAR
jgi:hypothetical protein